MLPTLRGRLCVPATLSPDFSETRSLQWGFPSLPSSVTVPRRGTVGHFVLTRHSLSAAFLLNLKHVLFWSKKKEWPWLLFCLLNPPSATSFQNFLDSGLWATDVEEKKMTIIAAAIYSFLFARCPWPLTYVVLFNQNSGEGTVISAFYRWGNLLFATQPEISIQVCLTQKLMLSNTVSWFLKHRYCGPLQKE